MYKILYVLYLVVSVIFSQTVLVGSLSVRHVLTVVVLVFTINNGGFKFDFFLKWYLVFVFFYTLSNVITGHISEVLMKLLGTYVPAMVLYVASKEMINKYESSSWIVYTLLTTAVLDAVVTIGQFYNNPIAGTISSILYGDNLNEELWEYYERHDTLHGISPAGLVGAVSNGYFLSATSVLALFNKKGKPGMFNWVLCAFLFFALFLVQERAGLYFGAFCILIYIILYYRQRTSNIFSIILVFFIAFFVVGRFASGIVNLEDTRYVTHSLDNGGRDLLAQNGWLFFKTHPMGGIMEFHDLGNRDSHNIIANSFIFGGIFGGLVLLAIIFVQLFKSAKILNKSFFKKKYSFLLIVFALMYTDYTLNSFFHNASLASGTALFFVFWGVVSSLYEIENHKSLTTRSISI